MELNNIKDAFGHVAKKQKLSCSKTQEVIEKLNQEIGKALETIKTSSQMDERYVLTELKKKLQELSPHGQLEGTQKELNIALSKYVKVLEKSFIPDISKAYRNVEFDSQTVDHIIANHFYRQGFFDVSDCFVSETKESENATAMKSSFQELYEILEAMRSRSLEPALKWAAANSDKLKANGSDLQLKLHSLQFVEILRCGSRDEALKYARAFLAPFASNDVSVIQKLMGCLIWARKLDSSSCPYTQLLSPSNWVIVAEELTRQFCNLVGQPYDSPLSVTIGAGIQALPPLLKFMNVMAGKRQEWQSMKQLPVPVELDKAFQFHSTFVCPVSKEESTEDNPPMMMSCGHVLCRQSINKMSKNNSRPFKCPYCPSLIEAPLCMQLYL